MNKGFLVIDKPKGMTSADVVYHVKKKLPKGTKIGHAGTLDPNVTGVLPLAIGHATKAFAFLEDTRKVYSVVFKLGVATDTEDIWGNVIETVEPPRVSFEQVENVLKQFEGEYLQTPPMYSAKKQGGVKLYAMARKGITVERRPERREIFAFEKLELLEDNQVSFTVTCSRGTYIRTLCVDIASALGTMGAMTALRRLETGCFTMAHAVLLDHVIASETLSAMLMPIDVMFSGWPKITVDEKHALHLRNGVKVNLQRFTRDTWPEQTRVAKPCAR